ncbi:MAG: Asp-tRNA(Asn)/Glu-tRNA(Gln) amidotransferase subunit GatC [Alphaproteobacteria bacterium]|nr:Asp-tRNA(Asn)/Glu-tRNA(Gln) amidotransferase subunit GatC [Alphaproteobacteria bacterium]
MDKNTVRKVAALARLEAPEDWLEKMAPQLTNILKFVEQLGEVNTDNVEPLANVAAIELKLREDKVTDGGNPEKVLKNAPEEMENYFVVPKVVEQEE